MIRLMVPELSRDPLNIILGHAVRWINRLKTIVWIHLSTKERCVYKYVQKLRSEV